MSDLATLQARLADAEGAYHQLQIGGKVARIRHNEREMTFTEASIPRLTAYIADLKYKIRRAREGRPTEGGRGQSRNVLF